MKRKHNKIVLLAKTNFNNMEVLINSCFSHNEFVLVNNVLKEYDDFKEKSKI